MINTSLKYIAIPIFSDNYVWCIHDGINAIIVDPGEATAVIDYLNHNKLNLKAILITHHHSDHIGGVADLVAQYSCRVYSNIVSIATNQVVDNEIIYLPEIDLSFKVLAIPGHTLDHIGFYGNGWLFSGDTLFSGGCGRVVEGTYDMMYDSLLKLRGLPKDTLVFPTHEYTVNNLKFARVVEPQNQDIKDYQESCHRLRLKGLPTLPVTLEQECMINPFLRCDNQHLQLALKMLDNSPQEVFANIREWKNNF